MELELNRNHLNHYELLYHACINQEETLETIVSDARPDILRIVDAGGQLYLSEKDVQPESALVRGTVEGWLLYQPEGEERLCKIEFRLPFSAKTDVPGLTPRGRLVVRPAGCKVDARTLNPRKVLVRADICVECWLYEPKELAVCGGIECDGTLGVQQLQVEQQTYLTAVVKEKEFSVYEELPAPAGLDGNGEILCMNADVGCTEAKIIGNKLIFKGESGLRIRYLAGGKLCSAAIPISFSQVMELDGAGEQGDCSVQVYATKVGCAKAGEDGRQMNITLDLVGQAIVAEKHTLTMLQDAYSTCGALEVEPQTLLVFDLQERYTKPQTLREVLETEVPAKSIIDTAVWVGPVTTAGSNVQAQVQIAVLYADDNDLLYHTSRTLQVAGQAEVPADCSCQATCTGSGDAFATITADGIEVRYNLDFCGCVMRKQPVACVKAARWSECGRDENEQRPSVILRAAMPGERLWDLAKGYQTTQQRICQANGFEQEEVPAGTMLLIPTGK